jgi:hypothetical protein
MRDYTRLLLPFCQVYDGDMPCSRIDSSYLLRALLYANMNGGSSGLDLFATEPVVAMGIFLIWHHSSERIMEGQGISQSAGVACIYKQK